MRSPTVKRYLFNKGHATSYPLLFVSKMLVANNFKCKLSAMDPHDPLKDEVDLVQYQVSVDGVRSYNQATCWVPKEQILTNCYLNVSLSEATVNELFWIDEILQQDLYPLPVKIQVCPVGEVQDYEVYIFHNAVQIYPAILCQWPPPPKFLNSQSANLKQLTFPGATTRDPLLFYAPGDFHVGEVGDATKTGGWKPPEHSHAPRESTTMEKNGTITVIVTEKGRKPILPRQRKDNLITFTFCYAPNKVIL